MELMKLFNTYLGPASDGLLDLGATSFRWNNLYLFGTMSSPSISTSTINVTVLTAISSNITSERFTRSVGSSLTLNNSSNAYLNVNILTHNAVNTANGDVWFRSSSNLVYLFIHSGGFTYTVAMNT